MNILGGKKNVACTLQSHWRVPVCRLHYVLLWKHVSVKHVPWLVLEHVSVKQRHRLSGFNRSRRAIGPRNGWTIDRGQFHHLDIRCVALPAPLHLYLSHSLTCQPSLFFHRGHSESSCGWQLFHTVPSMDINKSAGLNLTQCWANLISSRWF